MAGGGPDTDQVATMDTNMTNLRFGNVVHDTFITHDMGLLALDNNSPYFYIGSLQSVELNEIPFYNNYVIKVPVATLTNPVYFKPDYYTFNERGSIAYVDYDFGNVNGMNGLVATRGKLYMYDGAKIKRFNKTTGAILDSNPVSNTSFYWGGIDADCESNIYIGKADSLLVFDSNVVRHAGYKLTDTIYSVKIGVAGLLYACGRGFVSSTPGMTPVNNLSVTTVQPSSCASCNGTAIANASCGVAPFEYKWSNGATTGTITGLCSGVYSVTVTDGACPPDIDTAIVTIDGDKGFTVKDSVNEPGCIMPTGTIKALPKGGNPPYTYQWNTGATTQTITGLSAGTYYCIVTDSNGCKDSLPFNLMATSSGPSLTLVHYSDTICKSCPDSILVSGAPTYTWTPSTGLSCTNCPNPIATISVTTTYTVIGTDSAGCETELVITILVENPCADYKVPNVFTPTNPGPFGLDNVFYIKTENLSSWSIIIYDRWGKEMYKSTNPYEYWAGTTEGGKAVPDGVYYYLINSTCQGTTYKRDGFVQVIR
jgi:gliding motility-associated-like protein